MFERKGEKLGSLRVATQETPSKKAEPEGADDSELENEPESDAPAGNASREEWAEYARSKGASDEELVDDEGNDLGRNELRDKFGGE